MAYRQRPTAVLELPKQAWSMSGILSPGSLERCMNTMSEFALVPGT